MSRVISSNRVAALALSLSLMLLLGSWLCGCAQQNDNDTEEFIDEVIDDKRQPDVPADNTNMTPRVFGVETETSKKLTLKNDTGEAIVALSFKVTTDEAYSVSIIDDGQSIEIGEEVIIYFEPGQADLGAEWLQDEENETARNIVLRTLYDCSVTFKSENAVELHAMNFEEISCVTLCISDEGIAYVEYENESGSFESTLEAEKVLQHN